MNAITDIFKTLTQDERDELDQNNQEFFKLVNKPDSAGLNRKNSRNFDRGNIFYRFMHRSSQSKRRKLRRKWIQ